MPDYRKFHNRAGHSEKLASITDFEFRVWHQYRATADDFGVCPLSAAKLQGDNRRLAKEPAGKVYKAILHLIEVGLVVPFTHQNQDYLCQLDWQDFEDVRYPRQSIQPVPGASVFALLTGKTADLFRQHRVKDSAKFPHLACAGTRETQTLTQTQTLTPTETLPGEGPGEGFPSEPNTWTQLVDILAAEGSAYSAGVWFRPCRLAGEYPDALRVVVPNRLTLEWIPKHYSATLADLCARVAPGKTIRLELAKGAK